jgi:Aerotolerance regulator N-terminal
VTFLEPALLFALPLAALPVIIHLIHLYRRRQIKWAAMMFLLAAQRMNKGLSRLRQILILAFRVLAVAAIIFLITRPLAGGWLGLTGGAPDTVMILLDRSASMEQQNLATGVSKRAAGLRNLAKAINDAVGARSRLVLIDSALRKPLVLEKADALVDLPQTEATDTAGDIPALLQGALDYITTNKTGRTDVWLLSDLQRSDWDVSGGRWEVLRGAFAALQGVRFHLLCYPQSAPDDLGVTIDRVVRHETNEKAELQIDLRINRHVDHPQPTEVPLRFVVNGTVTTEKVELKENELVLQAHPIPIDRTLKRGWGRVELPADACPANNVFHFVFAEDPPLHSVIVSDDEAESGPVNAALSAPTDPGRKYQTTVLTSKRAAEVPWEDAALIVWNAPIPKPDEALAHQLEAHVAAGRDVIFLPPETPDDTAIFGLHWGAWTTVPTATTENAGPVEWWRNDADLLANTRDGAALPVGVLELSRRCTIIGDGVPLARVNGHDPLLMRSSQDQAGRVYFLGTLPSPAASSLARDGVVMFALLHRALNYGAQSLGKAQQRWASATALGNDPGQWHAADEKAKAVLSADRPLHAGVAAAGDRLIALNRPPGEDDPQTVGATELDALFSGLDYRVLTDTLEDRRSLTNEIWRTFLMAMALALIGEALLCMPPRAEVTAREKKDGVRNSPAKPQPAESAA